MADIFISYARSDRARVAPLVAAIEAKGWSVWWDPAIAAGQQFDDQIDAGKPSAVHAFVRILDHLNRLAPERLRLRAMGLRVGDEVDKMAERLDRRCGAGGARPEGRRGRPAKARRRGAIKPRRGR